MGVFYETIPQNIQSWILQQKMFWVATAPLAGSGHVNVSPKGGPYFGIISETKFWYMELSGSGCETLAHLHEKGNGRITVMFSAFEGAPKIVRLWGKGRVLERETAEFDSFVASNNVNTLPGTRSIIIVDVHQAGSSCGYSVPFFEFKAHRETLNDHYRKKDEKYKAGNAKESMDLYWAFKSQFSMDGIPAMKRGVEIAKREKVAPIKKMVGPLAPKNQSSRMQMPAINTLALLLLGFVLGLLIPAYAKTVISFGARVKETIPLHHGKVADYLAAPSSRS